MVIMIMSDSDNSFFEYALKMIQTMVANNTTDDMPDTINPYARF